MTVLALERVGKRYRDGARECVALSDVSIDLQPGELAVVWGMRGSGRSTLLRIAAGIEAPDSGVVRFEGRDLAGRGADALGAGIGYCTASLRHSAGQPVLEQVTLGLLARGVPPALARASAHAALERTGVSRASTLRLGELEAGEAVRVTIAGALALEPRLLIIDEPTKGVDLLERDGILLLLRSLADEGITVLASAGEATALSGADRAMSLSEGALRASPVPELAPVVQLRRSVGS